MFLEALQRVWKRLLKTQRKSEGESFSDVVLRLSKKEKKPLSYFFGRLSKEDADILEKESLDMRKKTKMRNVEF